MSSSSSIPSSIPDDEMEDDLDIDGEVPAKYMIDLSLKASDILGDEEVKEVPPSIAKLEETGEIIRGAFKRGPTREEVHQTDAITFDGFVRIDDEGKKQKQTRTMAVSANGISNEVKNKTKWFFNADDIYKVEIDPNDAKKVLVTVMRREEYDVDDEKTAERIIKTAKRLNLTPY